MKIAALTFFATVGICLGLYSLYDFASPQDVAVPISTVPISTEGPPPFDPFSEPYDPFAQENFPCQEDEYLGYSPMFGPDRVGCIHIDDLH